MTEVNWNKKRQTDVNDILRSNPEVGHWTRQHEARVSVDGFSVFTLQLQFPLYESLARSGCSYGCGVVCHTGSQTRLSALYVAVDLRGKDHESTRSEVTVNISD